jgi:hypothetical protein
MKIKFSIKINLFEIKKTGYLKDKKDGDSNVHFKQISKLSFILLVFFTSVL